jgi:poly(A) polymerase
MSKKKPKAPKRPSGSKPTPSSRAPIPFTASRSKWIPIERPIPLPPSAKEAIAKLTAAGFSAYLVGGAVRDSLLGIPVKDFDLATDARPEEIEGIFPGSIGVGRAFGVIRVPFGDPPEFVEVATFREDSEYSDYRHPRSVRFSGPEEDAARRDFTVNGLFYDPKTRRILDCVGGFSDLQSKRLRAIGDPDARFREDALRVLRAVRFSARLGFRIEEGTWRALAANSRFTRKVSAERIRDELSAILKGPRTSESIAMLRELGVVSLWLPEVAKVKPAVFSELGSDPEPRSTALVFAAALSETGGDEPEKSLQSACDRLRLSGEEKKRVIDLVLGLPKFHDAFQMREATLRRWVMEPYFDELLQLHRAVARATDGNLMAYRFLRKLREEARSGPPTEKLLTGADLVTLGFSPGPRFSDILRVVDDLRLEKKLSTKDEALEYVVKHFVR